MSKKQLIRAMIPVLLLVIGILSFLIPSIRHNREYDHFDKDSIRCAICLGKFDDSTRALVTGYNYTLLKDFAKDCHSEAIVLASRDTTVNYIDSLKNGSIDILVTPYIKKEGSPEGTICSRPIDSLSRWMVQDSKLVWMKDINSWFRRYNRSQTHEKYRNLYINAIYDPVRVASLGRKKTELSPYDSLFRAYAPKLGWDWRTLAALAFTESKFRLDAHSHKNAFGMMQLGKETADRFGVEDQLDPETNIDAAVKYLMFLHNLFSKKVSVDSSNDLTKFILAAYNGGHGKILDCISVAEQLGVYDSTWNSVHKLPELASEAGMDTVNLKRIDIGKVSEYVDEVMAIDNAFKAICP